MLSACHRAARSWQRSSRRAARCMPRRPLGTPAAERRDACAAPLPARLRRAPRRAHRMVVRDRRARGRRAPVGLPDHLLPRRDRHRRRRHEPVRGAPAAVRAWRRHRPRGTPIAPRPAHRPQRLRHRRGRASPTPRSSCATGALMRSGGAGASRYCGACGERQRRLRLRPRARGDAAGPAARRGRRLAQGPRARADSAATTASRSSTFAARSRSKADRPRSPAGPGSTTSGATPTSTRARSAGTGSA